MTVPRDGRRVKGCKGDGHSGEGCRAARGVTAVGVTQLMRTHVAGGEGSRRAAQK